MNSILHFSPKFIIQSKKVLVIIIVWMFIGFLVALCDYFLLHSTLSAGIGQLYYSFPFSVWVNVGAGFTSGLIFGSIMVFYVNERLREKPYWVNLLLVAFLVVVIFLAIIISIGFFLVPIMTGQSLLHAAGDDEMRKFIFDIGHFKNAIVWGSVAALTQFTLQINDKFGQGVLWNIIQGRYQPPRHEDRIFMFVDLQSSTSIAEKLGNEKYHMLLKDYYADITNAIINNKGEIYQYVGDEIVITWKMGAGLEKNHCLECFFDMRKTIMGLKEKYESKYGLVPDFKAGIHYGSVIAGEIGIIKRDITYSGDVMNTTSRIQGMCNEYRVKILCSDDLLQLLPVSATYNRIPIGEIELKGKESRVALSTLEYHGV